MPLTRPEAVFAASALVAAAVSIAFAPAIGGGNAPTDPTGLLASDNIELVTTMPFAGVIGGVEDGKGNLFATGVSGLQVFDITDPIAPTVIGELPIANFENEDVEIGGDLLLISNDAAESYGLLYVIDISDPTNPTLRSIYDTESDAVTGSFTGSAGHTSSCLLACSYVWMTDTGGYRVIDLTNPDSPVAVNKQPSPAAGELGILHDVQVDDTGLVWTVGFGGTAAFELPADYDGTQVLEPIVQTNEEGQSRYAESLGTDDGSGFNDYIHHNSRRMGNEDVVYVTEEDYSRPGCRGAGSFQRWDLPMVQDKDTGEMVITGEEMTPKDMWVTELLADIAAPAGMCSAHYFDVRDGLVAQGWYEQGLRLLDVTGDEIRQVGYYVPPTAMTWDASFPSTDPTGTVIYVYDASHGIDVLRMTLPDEGVSAAASVVAPVRDHWRVNTPAGKRIGEFGYACRLLVL